MDTKNIRTTISPETSNKITNIDETAGQPSQAETTRATVRKAITRSSSRGIGRSSSRNKRSVSRSRKDRVEATETIKRLMKLKKRDRIIEKTLSTSMAVFPQLNKELLWEQKVNNGYMTGVSRLILPEVFERVKTNFTLDTSYDITGKSGYESMPKLKDVDSTLDDRALYLNLNISFIDPNINTFVTTQRQLFRKENLGNGFVLYEVMNGKKCLPAIRSATFRISKPSTPETPGRIPLLNPVKIIKEHLAPYVKAIMTIDNKILPIPDDESYDNCAAIVVPKPNTITLFLDISITNEILI